MSTLVMYTFHGMFLLAFHVPVALSGRLRRGSPQCCVGVIDLLVIFGFYLIVFWEKIIFKQDILLLLQ